MDPEACSGGEGPALSAGPTAGPGMNTPGSSTASSGSTAPSAAATSTSPGPKRRNRRSGTGPGKLAKIPRNSGDFIAKVAALRAEGLSGKAISHALGVRDQTVISTLKLPETQIEVVRRRELTKQIASAYVPGIVQQGFQLASKSATAGDAKSFDAATRGIHALEKVSASVSGESRQMEVNHSGAIDTGQPTSAVEQLKVLIGVIIGHPRQSEPTQR